MTDPLYEIMIELFLIKRVKCSLKLHARPNFMVRNDVITNCTHGTRETMLLELGLVQYHSQWWGAGAIALLIRSDDKMPARKTIVHLLLKHTHSVLTQ